MDVVVYLSKCVFTCMSVRVCVCETWRGREREAGRDGRREREKDTGSERQREIDSEPASKRVFACT